MKKYVTIIIALMTFVVYGQNSPGQYTVKNAKINTQSSDFGTAFFVTDKYSKLTDLFNYRYNDGLNRYYAGVFETSSEARVYMNQMRKQGFKDAFVVGLKGESRF